jgi:hypothetical protein
VGEKCIAVRLAALNQKVSPKHLRRGTACLVAHNWLELIKNTAIIPVDLLKLNVKLIRKVYVLIKKLRVKGVSYGRGVAALSG